MIEVKVNPKVHIFDISPCPFTPNLVSFKKEKKMYRDLTVPDVIHQTLMRTDFTVPLVDSAPSQPEVIENRGITMTKVGDTINLNSGRSIMVFRVLKNDAAFKHFMTGRFSDSFPIHCEMGQPKYSDLVKGNVASVKSSLNRLLTVEESLTCLTIHRMTLLDNGLISCVVTFVKNHYGNLLKDKLKAGEPLFIGSRCLHSSGFDEVYTLDVLREVSDKYADEV